MRQRLAQGHTATQPDLNPGFFVPRGPLHTHPYSPKPLLPFVCGAASGGHSRLSLSRANRPQLLQLFLSNSIYNKLCLNFCLSDNNNNTIIIWSITYSQLYLIKAVISLRVSGNRVNRKRCTTRTSLRGFQRDGSGVTAAEAPEAGGHQSASGVRVLPPWSPGGWVRRGLRPKLESRASQSLCTPPSDLGWLRGKLLLSRLE